MPAIINPYAFGPGGGGGGPFSDPDDIPSLQVGYESDFGLFSDAAGTTPQSTHGGTTRCWKPKYGTLSAFMTRPAGNAPTLDTGVTVNGIQSLNIDGTTTQCLEFPNLYGALTEGEMMAVVKMAADPSIAPHYGFMYMGRSDHNTLYPYIAADPQIYDGYGSTVRKMCGVPVTSLAAWHVYNPYSAASDWALRLNNTVQHFTASNTVAFPDYGPFPGFLGVSLSGLDGFSTSMYHVAAVYTFSAKLTTTERNNMYGYINTKYGV